MTAHNDHDLHQGAVAPESSSSPSNKHHVIVDVDELIAQRDSKNVASSVVQPAHKIQPHNKKQPLPTKKAKPRSPRSSLLKKMVKPFQKNKTRTTIKETTRSQRPGSPPMMDSSSTHSGSSSVLTSHAEHPEVPSSAAAAVQQHEEDPSSSSLPSFGSLPAGE
jgi:hypothetical protein